MPEEFQPGLYEDLVTSGLRSQLANIPAGLVPEITDLESAEIPTRLSRHLARILVRVLESIPAAKRVEIGPAVVREIIQRVHSIVQCEDHERDFLDGNPRVLTEVSELLPDGSPRKFRRPLTSLVDTTFFTNSQGEPALVHELESEIDSAVSIDIVMAFVRWTGIRALLSTFKRHIELGRSVRLLTTVYTGSTEERALEALVALGVQVKVSYDVSQTRLHAKAWMFARPGGYSTAYIGSSNMSAQAQITGQEWNVRIAEATNADIIGKFNAVFETYWQSFDYKNYDKAEFRKAVQAVPGPEMPLLPFLIEPRPFQQRLLDDLEASRDAGWHKNLLVSATGTGKTVMAAFDFLTLSKRMKRSRLLFVAHRKEILAQSRMTFAQILRDPSFGELWVGGEKPSEFDYVFASIQTLSHQDIDAIAPDAYDVIIIDEFHHAAADSYKKILEHFKPKELLGLTATPERGDGQSILNFFDGRIAAELRIWDAVEQHYLAPFAYFGICDSVDLTSITWRRGSGYDPSELTDVYTASDVWIQLVIGQMAEKILSVKTMRALGFCVSVKHAKFVAEKFNQAGIKSVMLTGDSDPVDRTKAVQDLRKGLIQAVITVDLFNEGIDIPEVDTLLLLRPTDSGLLFMQQLGRGLRKASGKTVCTVLDFVGHHRKEFRYENRFIALLGCSRSVLVRNIKDGFPFLPSGCQISLDRLSQTEILENLKNATPILWRRMVEELKTLGDVSFKTFLEQTGLKMDDVYSRNRSFAELRREAGFEKSETNEEETALLRGVGRLRHIDDATRSRQYSNWLSVALPDRVDVLSEHDRRLLRMLTASITSNWNSADIREELGLIRRYPVVQAELKELLSIAMQTVDTIHPKYEKESSIPLRIHALYTRLEIQAALDDVRDGKIREWREGVRYLDRLSMDVFLFTIDKTSAGFSPTTRYRDYAISSSLIHWESQSTTSVASPTGQRYINHRTGGTKVLLFGRHSKKDDAFWFLGSANYVNHKGDRPIAFTWKLDVPLPAALFTSFAAAVA